MDKKKWQDLYRRLAEAREKTGQDIDITPPRNTWQKILSERARQLAKVEIEEKETPSLAVAEFRLANETYGFECRYIREIVHLIHMVPIPGTPDFVLGIINIRGQILSVIDLVEFFKISTQGMNEIMWVIVLENENMELGIIAEEILDVSSIPTGEIHPPLHTGIRPEYLKGITKNQLILLDAAKILSDEKMVINQMEI